jgi:hypothetical protein
MTSQIGKRIASPSRGGLRNLGRDWTGAALLFLVWTTLWTVFTAGVLAPASGLAARARPAQHASEDGRAGPGGSVPSWVAAR